MTTFAEFQSKREQVDNLADTGMLAEAVSGYVYGDLAYIEDTDDGKFYTIAEREDIITESLEEAERWIFDHWVRYL